MTAAGAKVQVKLQGRTGYLHGPPKTIFSAIRLCGSPWMWATKERTITVPIDRVSDVVAALEYRHRATVTIEETALW